MIKADFDIGTIFYILIAVVAAITSIVQKKNKKDETTKSPHPQETPKRTWDEVLTETFDIPEKRTVQPKPQPSTRSYEAKPVKKTVIESSFIYTEAQRESIANEGLAMTLDENDITLGEIGSSTESLSAKKFDFELRKAVIYSEILNRKY